MSSLVVNTNLTALNAYNNLNNTSNAESKAIGELSSGLAIQTAADGPAAYVTAQSLESQVNGYTAAMSNAQNGVSLIQTASGALNQIASILQTMNSLALSSASGATTDSAAANANQQEFSALQNQIDQIASTTQFGKTTLLNGSFSNQVIQVGADTSNANNQLTLSIQGVTTSGLSIGTTTVSIGSQTAAASAVTAVQAAISTVASIEANVGATQNQLSAIVANLTVGQQNLESAYSSLVNVNFAQETTQFSTDQILMQSGVSMLSQANQAPQMMLKLLQ